MLKRTSGLRRLASIIVFLMQTNHRIVNTLIASTIVLTPLHTICTLLTLASTTAGSSDEEDSDDEDEDASGAGGSGTADEPKASGVLPDGFFDDKKKDAIAHDRKPPAEAEKDIDEIMAEFEADVEKDVEALDGYEDKLVKAAVAAREKEDKEEQEELTERCPPPSSRTHLVQPAFCSRPFFCCMHWSSIALEPSLNVESKKTFALLPGNLSHSSLRCPSPHPPRPPVSCSLPFLF
jgi:hypothetical protein